MQKSRTLPLIFGFVGALFGLISHLTINFNIVAVKSSTEAILIKGFDAAFGTSTMEPNATIALAYMLPLAAGVLAILAIFIDEGERIVHFISIIGFIFGVILLNLVPGLIQLGLNKPSITVELLPGYMLGISFSAIGGLSQVLQLVKRK